MHETENYITLTQAAKLAPGRPSVNCIWRWCRRGVLARSGERVPPAACPHRRQALHHGRLATRVRPGTGQADANYFDLHSEPLIPEPAGRGRTEKQRQAAIERAERELKEMGV